MKRTLIVLIAALAVVPAAYAQAVGTWSIDAGPVADGDSSYVEIIEGQAGRLWGRWVRSGKQPIVAVTDIRFGAPATQPKTRELTLTAVMGAGPAAMRFVPNAEGAFTGEWTRGTEHFAFTGKRRDGVSAALEAANGPEVFEPGVISTPASESFSTFSPDSREVFYTQHKPDFSAHHIVASRYTGRFWRAPAALAFSGTYNDREPRLSPDGRRLFFSSNRPTPPDTARRIDLDLWYVERQGSAPFGAPKKLDVVNSSAQDFSPVVTNNGTLYFISSRAGGTGANHHIWRSRWNNGQYWEPERLDSAVSIGYETNVYVSPDEKLMIVSRDGAPDSMGGDDLYVSNMVGGRWQPMRHLDAKVNTWAYEYGPTVSPDGKWLYFTSDRRGSADLYRIDLQAAGVGGQ